jgi:phosphopantothenate---cysteine ligase (CTP)
MKVMVTAGGTTEKIDEVRSISNTSTGRLGSLIASRYAALSNVDTVYYICGKKAAVPQCEKVKIIYIDNVRSLENTIMNLLSREKIDIIVHSMAVSDYCVKAVTSVSKIADAIVKKRETLAQLQEQDLKSAICSLLHTSEITVCREGKINSKIDDLLLLMERTPKIISMLKKCSPKSTLVGFKLMDHVPHETLMETAFHVLKENDCDFVLANDLKDVGEENHVGYLIDRQRNCIKAVTKSEIADCIVQATTRKDESANEGNPFGCNGKHSGV